MHVFERLMYCVTCYYVYDVGGKVIDHTNRMPSADEEENVALRFAIG